MAYFMEAEKEFFDPESMPANEWDFTCDGMGKDTLHAPDTEGDRPYSRAEGSSSNRTTPKHKTSVVRFLTWVAYCRKNSPKISTEEQLSCPLMDCEEQPFDSQDAMLQHVYACPQLAKNGRYKCHNCERIERVSKCHANGCPEIHRFPKVASSLRRARKLFSPHGSRHRHHDTDHATASSYIPQECAGLDILEGTAPPELEGDHITSSGIAAELDTASSRDPHQILPGRHRFEGPAELAVSDLHAPYSEVQFQRLCSELSAGYDYADLADRHASSWSNTAELSTGVDSTLPNTEHSHRHQAHQWEEFSPSREEMLELAQDGFDSWMRKATGHNLPNQGYQSATRPSISHHDSTFHETAQPVLSPTSERSYSECPSLLNAGSRTNTSVSAMSFESNPSSRQTWMSSLDSIDSRFEPCEDTPSRFFGEETNLFFDEPESFDDSIEPVEMPANANTYSQTSASGYSSQEMVSHEGVFAHPCHSPSPIPIRERVQKTKNTDPRPDHPEALLRLRNPTPHSPSTSPPLPPGRPKSNYRCVCGFEPQGKEIYKSSNLKRHQNTKNCRRLSGKTSSQRTRRFPCPYPGCDRTFTRSDNRRYHQKTKDHLVSWEMLHGDSMYQQQEDMALHDSFEEKWYGDVDVLEENGDGVAWN